MPELPGDNNLDGRVDAADYTIWRDTLGMAVEPYGGADADGNGKIATADYQLWKSHFGQSLDSPGRAAGGDSISVAAAAESANQVDTLVAAPAPVTSMSLPPVGDRARVTTSATAAARHLGRQVRMIAIQVPAVDALAVWLAGQHPPYKRVPADNVVSEDEVASSSARECSVFQAADAALEILGTSRRRR